MPTLGSWQANIVDAQGNVIPNALIEVHKESDGTPAACFSAKDGTGALGGSFNADANGYVRFYVAGGYYRIDVTSGAFSQTFRDVGISNVTGFDREDLNIVSGIGLQASNLTYTVGTLGNFATLNEALTALSSVRPSYNDGTPIAITVNLLSGYVETEGVVAENIDLSHITITSVDATVTATVSGDLFHGDHARLPKIACRFDMENNGGHGIFLAHADVIVASPNAPTKLAGVINAGLNALNSIAKGNFAFLDADMQGANGYGAYVNHGSWGEIGDSDFSGAGVLGGVSPELGDPYNGIHVRHSSRVNLTGATNFRLGVSDSPNDVRVEYGGVVDLDSGVFIGGTSQPANLLTQHGIIFNSTIDGDVVQLLASGSLPAANALTITGIPDWVKRLQLDISGLSHNAGATRTLLLQVSTDNGSNYQTTGYIHMERTSAPADFTGTDCLSLVAPPLAAADTWSGTFTLHDIRDGAYARGDILGSTGGGVLVSGQGIYRGNNARINAIRLIINGTGSYDAGTYGCRGFG